MDSSVSKNYAENKLNKVVNLILVKTQQYHKPNSSSMISKKIRQPIILKIYEKMRVIKQQDDLILYNLFTKLIYQKRVKIYQPSNKKNIQILHLVFDKRMYKIKTTNNNTQLYKKDIARLLTIQPKKNQLLITFLMLIKICKKCLNFFKSNDEYNKKIPKKVRSFRTLIQYNQKSEKKYIIFFIINSYSDLQLILFFNYDLRNRNFAVVTIIFDKVIHQQKVCEHQKKSEN